MKKKEILIIILFLLLSYPAVKSLFIPGGFTSHDLTHHVIRQINMDKLLSEGQFPPRWSGDLNNGYGYPLFLFNYPLPAFLGEVFHKLRLGFVDSVKAVLFTSMVLSVLGMYLFLRSYLDSRLAAILGAIFYLYAPIRFLNVYVSASVGSALAAGIVPFVFWSLVMIKKREKWAILAGSFSLAGLILAHNVTTLIFIPVILTFAGLLLWKCKDKKLFLDFGLMFLLGIGLSAWFWLPAIFEKQYIQFDQIYQDFYKNQFVNLWQLIRSPWGYGLSHPQNPESGDMSYQLGLIHIGVMVVFSLWFLVYGRRIREIRQLGGFTPFFFLLSIFLMLKISLPVWESLPFLSIIQFPLRFQATAIFAASIAVALLIKYLPLKKLLVIGLMLLVIYANRNHWKINEVFNPGEDYYLSLKTTTASYGEHLPKWGRVMGKASQGKLEFVKEKGQIRIVKDQSAYVLAEVEATTASKLRFNQFYFPGWEIKVDEKKIDFNYLIDGKSYGLPVFDISEGKHQILAEFKNTLDRNIADTISVIIIITVIIIICRQLVPRMLKIKKFS